MASKKTGKGKATAKTRKKVSTKGSGITLTPKALNNLKVKAQAFNKALNAIGS